ncbi:glycoside hydrolase family 5 protein [Streptomyces sp. NPDC051064]|uniref:glycoside hydrolase family 5 protein n=1 Tax=Streptomyces sp. NPDC051064 TaxID=3365641 RepID=UPI00379F2152
MTWSDHQAATAPYTIDATYLDRVEQVVQYALDEGPYVVLNVHHDSSQWVSKIATEHDTVRARFDATWTQIAERFKDAPRTLLFEAINEPTFEGATAEQKAKLLDELQVSFHRIVRDAGGNNDDRLLVLTSQVGTPSQELMDDLHRTITSLDDARRGDGRPSDAGGGVQGHHRRVLRHHPLPG